MTSFAMTILLNRSLCLQRVILSSEPHAGKTNEAEQAHSGILVSHKKRMEHAMTWMNLGIIILSKSDKERQIFCYH